MGSTGRPGDVQARIVAAALECFSEYGVAKSTMEDIAQRARLSRITVHRHFGSREALLQEVLAAKLVRFSSRARRELQACGSLQERIMRYITLSVSVGVRDKSLMALLDVDASGSAGDVVVTSEVLRRSIEELWRPFLEEARSGGELRPELNLEDASYWIMIMQFLFVESLHRRFRGERLSEAVLRFVVPVFVPDSWSPERRSPT